MKLVLAIVLVLAACSPRGVEVVHTARYPDGHPLFAYGVDGGVPYGVARVWYPNGKLRSIGRYVRGVKEGNFSFYDENGGLVARITYSHDVVIARAGGTVDFAAALDLRDPPPRDPAVVLAEIVAAAPKPTFVTLDRTTDLSRAGAQLGVSGGDGTPFGDVSHYDVFTNVMLTRIVGVYAQASESLARSGDSTVGGRQTIDVGATFRHALTVQDHLVLRGGFIAAIGNTDESGMYAASLGAAQRAADSASAMPASLGLRSSATYLRRMRRFVAQGDAGVDWMLGERDRSIDPLLRINAALGYRVFSAVVGAELATALRVRDSSQHVATAAVSSTFWYRKLWFGGAVSVTQAGEVAAIGSVGYAL